jgi:phosphate transport system permease protein
MSTTTPPTGPSERITAPGGPGRSLRRPAAGLLADRGYLLLVLLSSGIALAMIGYLIWTTASETGDVWSTFGVWGFLTGTEWVPTPAEGDPLFGALPFIYGTLVTSVIAMALAVPLAIGVALATTVFLPRRLLTPVAAIVDLLAAVPSVVYGLWGIAVLVPAITPAFEWIAGHNLGIGLLEGPVTAYSYLISGIVLAIMVLPIIAAITREVLLTVPRDQQEAALALGATRWEMVRSAMLPWARSGIVGASALGLGRAVGETIALALLLGNTPGVFDSLLGPGATLASVIALEFNEASGLHLSSLIALAIVLFVLAFAINAVARLLVSRTAAGPGALRRLAIRAVPRGPGDAAGGPARPEAPLPPSRDGLPPLSRSRRVRSGGGTLLVYACLAIALAPLVAILAQIVVRGAPAISWTFLTEIPPSTIDTETFSGGIANAIVGTLIMVAIGTAFAAPLGVLVALSIHEVASSGPRMRRLGDAVSFVVDVLLGVPSIVVGLIVYLGLVVAQGHFSALAGGVAMGIIMFPIVVRSTDEILRLVPLAQKEAALSLGAPRWRTTWSVVLPIAAPGILTGVMLAIARAAGETAPLLFTSLGNQFFSTDINEPIAALPQFIYQSTIEFRSEATVTAAWGAALVLVSIILVLNVLARLLAARTRPQEGR